jgi:hypothetical protein
MIFISRYQRFASLVRPLYVAMVLLTMASCGLKVLPVFYGIHSFRHPSAVERYICMAIGEYACIKLMAVWHFE